MGGRSLPVWAIVLFVGVLVVFSLGCWNPFIRKEDKEEAKKFSNSKSTFDSDLKIEMKFHFNEMLYIVVAIFFTLAAVVLFFIESFAAFKNLFFDGGVLGSLVALLVVLVVSFVAECVLIIISIATEEKTISSLVTQYARRYDVDVIVKR